jgi:hypothetical protein
MSAALVFIAQLFYIFLLGIQSRNVRDGQMVAAAVTSGMLGVCGLYMTSEIAKAATSGEGAVTLAIAYVAAGPCGICLAIWLHDKVAKND